MLLLAVFLPHLFFFLYCYCNRRDLHSFPTRRSSDLIDLLPQRRPRFAKFPPHPLGFHSNLCVNRRKAFYVVQFVFLEDRKSTRLNSSHPSISYAVFCLKKKNKLISKLMTLKSSYKYG